MDNEKKAEKKEWKKPELSILDVESKTMGISGVAATDGPFYS
jgi:hypothetical protein